MYFTAILLNFDFLFQKPIQNGTVPKNKKEGSSKVALFTAIKTYVKFHLLMFLDYISQIFFSRNVVPDKHRKVSLLFENYEYILIRLSSYLILSVSITSLKSQKEKKCPYLISVLIIIHSP